MKREIAIKIDEIQSYLQCGGELWGDRRHKIESIEIHSVGGNILIKYFNGFKEVIIEKDIDELYKRVKFIKHLREEKIRSKAELRKRAIENTHITIIKKGRKK